MNRDTQIQLYLASSSPRRKELLTQMGLCFGIVSQEVQETPVAGESAEDFVLRLASEKALAGFKQSRQDGLPVIGSDTIVVVDGQVLGKPENRQHGIAMLMNLSNKTHQVMTAVAIKGMSTLATTLSISRVTFTTLNRVMCEHYWDTGEPADKAGGYAIQGKGAVFIKDLQGSYSGVMGLPVYETACLLKQFNIHVL